MFSYGFPKHWSTHRKLLWLKLLQGAAAVVETVTGNLPLTLANALSRAILSLTRYGLCAQDGTPTPDAPVDILCNNGALKMVDDELPAAYRRVLGFSCNNNALWEITGFHLRGSDTVRISFEIGAACNVFGCYQGASANDNYDLYASTSSSSKYFRYGNGAYASYFSASNQNRRFDVVYTPYGSQGMPEDSTWDPLTFTSENDLLIGSTTLTGSSAKLKGKLYGNFEVDGRLKLIPCERVSDGVLGYYDTYGATFYEPYEGFDGAVSLGYDGSHYSLAVVGAPEALSLAPIGSATQDGTPAPDNYVPVVGTKMGNTELFAIDTDADTYAPATQTITRVIGKKVFNGTETFSKSTAYGNAFLVNAASSSWGADRTGSVLCTHFLGRPQSSGTQEDNTCFFNQTGHFYFRVTDNSDTDAFKSWLAEQYAAGTPVVVYFVRSSSTTEAYTGSPVGGTASVADLYAVGDYKDTQEIIGGTVTHKVGVKVLDGTESGWTLSDSGSTHRFRGVKPSDCHTPASRAPSACTHFKYVSTGSAVGGMFIGASQYWYFIPTDQTIDTVDEWTDWLASQYAAGTPVIVLYPLATETTEQTTAQHLNTVEGTNVVDSVANVGPVEAKVEYMKAA